MKNLYLFGNTKINLLLLVDITLIVYLTVIVSDFSSLDDTALMEEFQHTASFSSLVHSSGSTYLRPLIMISYLVDYILWGANPVFFHWTNLVIHLCNACLVYYLSCLYLSQEKGREGVSLLAALFFAITPLNSESVAWVSGRTDLICTFFFLVSIVVLISKDLPPVTGFLYLFIAFFCSLLAKESSLALTVIVPLYLFFVQGRSITSKFGLCGAVLLSSLLYLILRAGPNVKTDTGIMKLLVSASGQPLYNLFFKSVAAFGFYVRKLVWPFPLNLAIHDINEPLYFSVGLVAIVVAVPFFVRFPASRLPLLIMLTCLIPPLLALTAKIPWTLYAERYLYLSTTGMALLVGLALIPCRSITLILVYLLLIPLGISTIYRTGQWAEPVTLWHDTTVKSSGFPQARVIYAYELIQVGRIAEAEENIMLARRMKFENELLLKCESSIIKLKRASRQRSST